MRAGLKGGHEPDNASSIAWDGHSGWRHNHVVAVRCLVPKSAVFPCLPDEPHAVATAAMETANHPGARPSAAGAHPSLHRSCFTVGCVCPYSLCFPLVQSHYANPERESWTSFPTHRTLLSLIFCVCILLVRVRLNCL